MKTELETNRWMVAKTIRRFLREGRFLPSLYENEIGNEVLKPSERMIDKYFGGTEQKIVREDSQ